MKFMFLPHLLFLKTEIEWYLREVQKSCPLLTLGIYPETEV